MRATFGGVSPGAICQSCGLCCDGSLFGRVQLAAAEIEPARRHGLLVLPSGSSFEQPCSALGPARACACYDERPARCRQFVCRTLDRMTRGELSRADAEVRIARARSLLDVVTGGAQLSPPEVTELTTLMADDLARAD
ncbi:MAG: hypothetical protein JWP97_3739 [Labilithrix sp.]|nr:hypothetical protein [Labilithrix sp.]